MGTKKTDVQEVNEAIKKLTKALEIGMYGLDTPYHRLISFLIKLNIKNAEYGRLTVGKALEIESLESILAGIKFDNN